MESSIEGRPRVVVFDVGGVLIEWNPRHLFRKIFGDDVSGMERFLNQVCSTTWNLMQDAGRSFEAGVAELSMRFPEERDRIAAYHERWEEMVPHAYDDEVAVLEELKAAGVPVYAITNFAAEKLELIRRRFAFFDQFDGIVVSSEVQLIKPDPAIFLHFLETYDLAACDCVFIDDSALNIDVAAALGFQVVHHESAGSLRRELTALGLPLEERASTA